MRSLCSLTAEHGGGALLPHTRADRFAPKQICERQMVAANERGEREREGAAEGSLEGGCESEKKAELGNTPVDIIKVGCRAV